jgi:hypothetical protein
MASEARAIRKGGTELSLRASSYSPLLEKSRHARFMLGSASVIATTKEVHAGFPG